MAGELLRRDDGEMRDVGLVGTVERKEEAMAIEAPLIVLFHDS